MLVHSGVSDSNLTCAALPLSITPAIFSSSSISSPYIHLSISSTSSSTSISPLPPITSPNSFLHHISSSFTCLVTEFKALLCAHLCTAIFNTDLHVPFRFILSSLCRHSFYLKMFAVSVSRGEGEIYLMEKKKKRRNIMGRGNEHLWTGGDHCDLKKGNM